MWKTSVEKISKFYYLLLKREEEGEEEGNEFKPWEYLNVLYTLENPEANMAKNKSEDSCNSIHNKNKIISFILKNMADFKSPSNSVVGIPVWYHFLLLF